MHKKQKIWKIINQLTKKLQQENDNLLKKLEIYKTIVDYALDWEMLLLPTGEFSYCSNSCQKISGYEPKEFIENHDLFLQIIHPLDKKIVEHHFFNKLEQIETEVDLEFRIITKDGKLKWIQHFCQKAYDTKGELIGYRSSNRDITDRKLAEEKLKASENRLKEAEKIAHLGCWEFNLISNVLTWSDEVFRIFDLKPQEIEAVYEAFWDCIHPDDRKKVNEAYTNSLKTKNNYEIEHRLLLKNGKIKYVLEKGNTEYDNTGKPIRSIGTVLDITDRKLAEEKLKENEKKYRELSMFLRLMADNQPDMLWAKNLKKEYIFVNKAICTDLLNAKDTDEPLGKTEMFFFERERNAHPDNPKWHTFGEMCKDSDAATLEAMKPMQFDEFGKVKGKFLFLDVHKAPLYDSNGQVIGVVGSARNITAAKETENQLRKLSQAVEQSPVSVVITDLKGTIEYVNPKFIELTGYTYKEAIGQNPRILKSGHTTKEEYKELWDTITAGKEWRGEFYNRKNNGEFYWESALISPIRNSNNEITHFIAIKEDITERKRIEQELVIAKEKAEESDRLKSAFLANMSHEIRTPMNGILGFASLLKEPKLTDEEMQKYIQMIEKSGNRMLNIINDIIDISKIEAGLMKFHIQETNVNEQIEYIYTFFKPEAMSKGIELSFKNSLPAKEATIKTDREKLYAILTNLVKNAIKYTDEGFIKLGYHLKKNNEVAELEFYVKDTGWGIPQNRQEAIFERFIQADITDKKASQGAGLGLAITKTYVEKLGGKIWVESTEGKGSTFYFTLPYNTESTIEMDKQLEPSEKYKTVRKLKILIVEDDDASEMLMDHYIKTFSHKILKVRTGIEAVEACRNHPDIDLVLMDIRLPEMNGYKATKLIREFNKEIIIIAQTAYGLTGDKEKAMEAGCNDYITKPIKKAEIQAIIQKFFGNDYL